MIPGASSDGKPAPAAAVRVVVTPTRPRNPRRPTDPARRAGGGTRPLPRSFPLLLPVNGLHAGTSLFVFRRPATYTRPPLNTRSSRVFGVGWANKFARLGDFCFDIR